MADALRLGPLLEAKILTLKGVWKKRSRWMDKDAFYIGQREFAHFQRNDQIDVRLTRSYQRKYSRLIRGDRRVGFRSNPSEWIQIQFRTHADVEYAFRIISLALNANKVD